MTDKEFWLMLRRALLMICKAIEKKYTNVEEDEIDNEGQITVSYLAEE